ncbi:SPBc2 prophage-derived uncharacterized protein YorR [compost metagenome]
MKIILEGPDGAGKSTLASVIATMTGFPIQHRSKPETEEEKQLMYCEYGELCHNYDNLIIDRCWYSEMIYGKVMRDQAYLDANQMLYFEEGIANFGGGIIIHCTDKVETLWERLQSRGEDYITDFHKLADITLHYEMLMHQERHILPVVRYAISKKMY